jgi:hypothetical protein
LFSLKQQHDKHNIKPLTTTELTTHCEGKHPEFGVVKAFPDFGKGGDGLIRAGNGKIVQGVKQGGKKKK